MINIADHTAANAEKRPQVNFALLLQTAHVLRVKTTKAKSKEEWNVRDLTKRTFYNSHAQAEHNYCTRGLIGVFEETLGYYLQAVASNTLWHVAFESANPSWSIIHLLQYKTRKANGLTIHYERGINKRQVSR